MKFSLKQSLQIALSLLVAIGIFWYLYKDIKMESLTDAIRQASFFWIALSIIISIWAYWLRAWRWKLLINVAEKDPVNTLRVFWALMTGYLANLLVPRAGEVVRCAVLKKTDQLHLGKLLGTVFLERTVDLLFLVLFIFIAFFAENEVFLYLLGQLGPLETFKTLTNNYLTYFIVGLFLVGILFFWILNRYKDKGLIKKLRNFVKEFLTGLKSVRHLKNQLGFWTSSILIWIIYFLMMYFVAIGIHSTSGLTPSSVLMVMVFGSIGMIAPVQGGIGTFHALVAFILIYYGLTDAQAKIFAVIIHSTQLFTIIVLGIISSPVLVKYFGKEEPIIRTLR